MKATVHYTCEICGNTSTDKAEIERCEARGTRDPVEVPRGCLFYSDGFYKHCLFAAAAVRRGAGIYFAHELTIACWATRNNSAGDNVGPGADICGGDSGWYRKGKPSLPPPDDPITERMLKALEKMGIRPTIWDGEKAVPLEEFK